MTTFLSVPVGTIFKISGRPGLWAKVGSEKIQAVEKSKSGHEAVFVGSIVKVTGNARVSVLGAGTIPQKRKPKKKCACSKAVGEVLDDGGIEWAHQSLIDTIQNLNRQMDEQKARILALTKEVSAAVKKKNGSGGKRNLTTEMDQVEEGASFRQSVSPQKAEKRQIPVSRLLEIPF